MKYTFCFVVFILFVTLVCTGQTLNFPGYSICSFTIDNDGKRLMLVSDHTGKQLLYESTRLDSTTWSVLQPVVRVNEFSDLDPKIVDPALSFDGTSLYFGARYVDSMGYDIYQSKLVHGAWSTPVPVPELNTIFDETGPSISPNNMELYFCRKVDARSAPFGENCRNMYKTRIMSGNTWEKPYLLHSSIQSDCDGQPKIAVDGKILFFTSYKRNDSKGDWDIFYTRFMTRNMIQLVKMVDSVNTKGAEENPVYVSGEKRLYYLKTVKKERQICFTRSQPSFVPFTTISLRGSVTLKETGKPIQATINVFNASDNQLVATSYCDQVTGSYALSLSPGKNYTIEYLYPGLSRATHKLNAENVLTDTTVGLNIELFKEMVLTVNIVDDELFSPVDCMFEVLKNNEPTVARIHRVRCGCFKIHLEVGNEYQIVTHDYAYKTDTLRFDIRDQVQYSAFDVDIELQPIKIDFNITLVDKNSGDSLDFPICVKNKQRNEVIELKSSNRGKGKYVVKLRVSDSYEITSTQNSGYFYMSQTVNMAESQGETIERTKVALPGRRLMSVSEMESQGYLFMGNMLREYAAIDKSDTALVAKWKSRMRLAASGSLAMCVDSSGHTTSGQLEEELRSTFNDHRELHASIEPIVTNSAIEIHDIYFETNSFTLNYSSFVELDRLVSFMTRNATVNIKILAHTDDVGEEDYNQRLSELRALSVVHYLIHDGVRSGRLSYQGLGELYPVLPNTSDENRAMNRRVECKIIK